MHSKTYLRNLNSISLGSVLFFFLISMHLHPAVAYSQISSSCKGSENKKASKLFFKAENLKKSKKDYEQIKQAYIDAIAEDSAFAEAYFKLAGTAYIRKDYKTAMNAYDRFIKYCEDAKGKYYFRRANSAFQLKKYEKAEKYYSDYLSQDDIDSKLEEEAELNRYRSKAYANPVPFDPKPLQGVSTVDPEYLPIISADGELCFFTRRYNVTSKNSLTPKSVEKFMMSELADGSFSKGEPLPDPFNQKESNNEGGATITLDNQKIFFTVNDDGNFDIYTSDFRNGIWSKIIPLPGLVNHPKQWDSQPSVSSDGKTLYFASFRDSVNRTSDLFETKLQSDGTWSKPIKLPAPINTEGNEKSPFIHSDNQTLYFASDGKLGMGGFDIYMCKKNGDGSWSEPVGLGYPINTINDEVGFFVSTDGNKGYFASNKLNGTGGYDIYEFDLNPEIMPERVLLVTGTVKDENNTIPLNARIELKNVETKETIQLDYDTLTGKYASVVLFDNDYIMTVKKKGFGFVSSYFSKEDSLSSVRRVDMEMKEVKAGNSFKLNNILFDFNSSELNEVSEIVISNFYEFLLESPELKIELQGHTDNVGNDQDNLELSEARAKAVYTYLLELGADEDAVSYRGYGESKPVASNDDEEGRKLNRRTEFVIIENGLRNN